MVVREGLTGDFEPVVEVAGQFLFDKLDLLGYVEVFLGRSQEGGYIF